MPPLPTLWDPAGAVDKLPQPFRMIDKILADIVEQVVDLIGHREQLRKREDAARVSLTFAPHAVMEVAPETCGFLPLGIAGLAVVAMADGELRVHSARDGGTSCSDRTHSSRVTAMEAGMVVSTSGRLFAAASRDTLTLHEVDIRSGQATLLAQAPLPPDPDDPRASPSHLEWSPNLGHLAVCYGGGAVALFGVALPPPNVSLDTAGMFVAMNLAAFGDTRLEQVLQINTTTVKAFCLGCRHVGRSHVVWQLRQRPDKDPNSDRYHKSARGVYLWWEGANRLALIDLAYAAAAGHAAAAPAPAEAAPATPGPGSKPVTPAIAREKSKASAAAAAAAAAAEAAAAAAAAAASSKEPSTPPVIPSLAPHSRDWLLPYNITCAASTADAKVMAWGLADGSVVVWDDRACCSTKVLPRLKGAVTALSWVNGVAHKLMCASEEGHIFIADIIKPEDSSQKPYELPQPVHEIRFLANEPFALCICRGHTGSDGSVAVVGGKGPGETLASGVGGSGGSGGSSVMLAVQPQRPRILWYDVLEEKPVAELMGPKAGQGFGLACCVDPPPPPTRQGAGTDASGAAAGDAVGPAGVAAAAGSVPGSRASTAPGAMQPLPPMEAAPAAGADGGSGAHVSKVKGGEGASLAPGLSPPPVPPGPPPPPPPPTVVRPQIPAGTIVSYPAIAFKDTYLIMGGDVLEKVVASNFAVDESEGRVRSCNLYMYKVDALIRHLLPSDESESKLGKVVLDRLLADLEAPRVNNKKKGKRVKMDVEDPDAPKLASSLRKPDPFDPAGGSRPSSRAANRHITFGTDGDGNVFDDTADGKKVFPKETKVFPKETKKGLKTGPDAKGVSGKPRLAPLDLSKANESAAPSSATWERSQSPPWHHTNPLARIHPDWEEAPVLVRIMERIGSKGGGRKRRDKRYDALIGELMTKYEKEAGARPNLLVEKAVTRA